MVCTAAAAQTGRQCQHQNANVEQQGRAQKSKFKSCVLDPYSESHTFQIRQLARYSQIRPARFSQMPLFVAFERFQSRLPPRRSPQFMTAPKVAHERLCGSCTNSLKLLDLRVLHYLLPSGAWFRSTDLWDMSPTR